MALRQLRKALLTGLGSALVKEEAPGTITCSKGRAVHAGKQEVVETLQEGLKDPSAWETQDMRISSSDSHAFLQWGQEREGCCSLLFSPRRAISQVTRCTAKKGPGQPRMAGNRGIFGGGKTSLRKRSNLLASCLWPRSPLSEVHCTAEFSLASLSLACPLPVYFAAKR